MRFYTASSDIHRTDREGGHKDETVISVKEGIPHNCVDLPPLLSAETTGVSIPMENTETFFAAVKKSPQRLCSDTEITEILDFRNKSILAGVLNAKHLIWISKFATPQILRVIC
jgi:hypothetical protein